jgi:hypothetical protein
VVPVTWHRAITVALVVLTALAIVVNAVVATPTIGPPVDSDLFGPAGGHLLTGHWAGVFGDPIIQAGPLELVFWGVPFLLGIQTQLGWIIVSIVVGTLLSLAFALLAERLLRPLAPVWSVPMAILPALLAALTGQTAQAVATGHPAEYVIPLMWIGSAMLARRGSALAAAALLGATAGWELWGLLGVPILLLAPRIDVRTVWRSAVGGIGALLVLFAPFVLLGPFHMFSFSWPIYPNTLAHLLFPHDTTFPWPLRLTQGVLSVGGGALVAWLTRRQADAIWLVPLVVCAVRLFTDPVLARYYGIPLLMMILLGLVFAIAQRSLPVFIACLVMFNLLVDLELTVVTAGVLLALVIATSIVVVRGAGSAPRIPDPVGATQ